MRTTFVRRLVAVLVVFTLTAWTAGPIIPQSVAAQPCAMMMDMSASGNAPSAKGAMPVCGVICVVGVVIPAPPMQHSVSFAWTTVRYWSSASPATDRAIPPDTPPPISYA